MSGRATALVRARRLREVLLDHGVPEVSIELQPGRPGPADPWNALDPVGVLSHHIASHPTPANPVPGLALVKRGRSDLPGPLCNGTAGVDLVYRIICLGWANHSGSGGPLTLRGPLGAFTIPRDQGRGYLWGTEYEGGYTNEVWDRTYTNRRTGKSMTFREFMGRSNAGLVEGIWLPGISSRGLYDDAASATDLAGYHGEHKTWAPRRKPDRKDYSTESGRAELRRWASKEDDMASPEIKAQLDKIEADTAEAARLAQQTLQEFRAGRKAQGPKIQATRRVVEQLLAETRDEKAQQRAREALAVLDAPEDAEE